MTLVSSLTSMAANVWDYFSIPIDPLWKRALDEPGYREYLAFESAIRTNFKSVEEHISNKTILPQTLRTILLKQQDQLERFTSPYFYDKKLKRLQDKLNCPKPFTDVLEESRARLKEKLTSKSLIAKQSFYNDVINHLIKQSANLDLHVINADNLADVINYYQGIIPAEIFDPIKAAIENNPITDQKNIEALLKTVNVFFFNNKAKDISSVISKQVDQFRSRSVNLKSFAAMLAWSYVGAGLGVSAQGMGGEFLKVLGLNTSNINVNAMAMNSVGEIFVAGSTLTFETSFTGQQALLIKFYANGTEAWNSKFGDSGLEIIYAMIITPEDEILMAGVTGSFPDKYSEVLVIKCFDNSTIAWATAFGGLADDYAHDIIVSLDASMILVTGYTASAGVGGGSSFVASLFNNGTLDSVVGVDGPGGEDNQKIITNVEGEKFLLMTATGFMPNFDVLLTKISANDTHVWTTLFGGIDYADYGKDFTITSTGKILVIGSTFSIANGFDAFIASFSPTDGALEWKKTIGGNNSNDGYAIAINVAGEIIFGGYSYEFESMYLGSFFDNSTFVWARTIEGGSPDMGYYGLMRNAWNEIFVSARTITPSSGSEDVLLAKLNSKGDIPGCNLTHSYQPTVMDWQNVTVRNVTSEMNIFPLNFSFTDLSNITVQSISLEELFSCQSNFSIANSTATLNNTTPLSNVPTSSQNSQTTTISTPSSSSNNPTTSTSSNADHSIKFSVIVSSNIIPVDSDSIMLSSEYLSVAGNVDPRTVIYTVRGDMPDWVSGIYVDGVFVTQFTQQDVEAGFVSIPLNGVGCEDEHTLALEATVEGTDLKVDVDLIFEMSTCTSNESSRLSNGFLFSAKMLSNIGLWANARDKSPPRSCHDAAKRSLRLPMPMSM